MKVVVADPSLFTLPYDLHFCRGLAAARAETTLIGRPLRAHEHLSKEEPFDFLPLFYRVAESRLLQNRGGRGLKLLKGGEHALGFRALANQVGRLGPDVLHLQWLTLPRLERPALLRLRGRMPLVLTVHNSDGFHGSHSSRLQVTGHTETLRLFDGYVVHTEKTQAHLLGLGIDPERIRLLRHPPLRLQGEIPPVPACGPPTILFFGALKPYKGVDLLIEAGLHLEEAIPDLVVQVAGKPFLDPEDVKARIAKAVKPERFRLDLRHVPDAILKRYLAQADVVVFPYREIDGSGALSLATEYGKPIVATQVGAFTESPIKDHVRLVPSEDPKALAQALVDILRRPDERERLAGESLRLREALNSWDHFAKECLEFYEKLAASQCHAES